MRVWVIKTKTFRRPKGIPSIWTYQKMRISKMSMEGFWCPLLRQVVVGNNYRQELPDPARTTGSILPPPG